MAVGEADLLPVSCNGGLGYLNQSSCWKKKMESPAENMLKMTLKALSSQKGIGQLSDKFLYESH